MKSLLVLLAVVGFTGLLLTTQQLVFAEESLDALDSVYGFSEDDFDTGRFSYLHYGEKFYQYKYHPFGALSGDSSSRCHFTSDFVLTGNSPSESGHVLYKFPNDMIWPGGYENSTFYIVRSPSFNFPEDNNFEKLNPTKSEDDNIILEFDLLPGLNTFVANSTAFWDYQRSQIVDCPNPFDFEKQKYEYYDFVYPLKVQQNYAKMFGLTEDDFLCKTELEPVLKIDGSPACVKPETKIKLVEREWTEIPKQKNDSGHPKKPTLSDSEIPAIPKDITTMKPNSMEFFYYPEESDTKKPDTYKMFMLIRLPEWMGGEANDVSAFRAYSAKSLDDACIVKYWPDDGRQRIENPCQGAMYRVVDGAMTTGLIYSSTSMTALPYLDLSIDEKGLLYVEPPKWTKTENGVIGYGREISFGDFRNGSEFLAESFAKTYPEYPPIPLQFAGYDLSEIAPEKYRANVSYLDFPDSSGSMFMTIGKQSVGTGHTYWTKSQSELFQIGDTIITINKYVFERDGTATDSLRTYEIRFKDDGFYYAINGKNLEFIKKEIVKNFFPEYEYDDMLLISKNIDWK